MSIHQDRNVKLVNVMQSEFSGSFISKMGFHLNLIAGYGDEKII